MQCQIEYDASDRFIRPVNARAVGGYGSITRHRRLDTLTNEAVTQRFELRINTVRVDRLVANNPGFTRFNVATSVMTHELGHLLGVIDNPATPSLATSIMFNSRNRNTITGPNQDDIAIANFLNN